MTETIQQIAVLASIREGVLEGIVYKNGGDPVFYKTEKMLIDDIKDLLEGMNKETIKI